MYLLIAQHHVTLYWLLHQWAQPSGVTLCSTVLGKVAAIFGEEKAPLLDTHSCENLRCHRWPQQYTMQQSTQLIHQVCRVWVTDSRQQSPSSDWPVPQPVNNFTTNIHYHAQRSLSLVCNLSQMNPVHSIPFYFPKFHYNTVLLHVPPPLLFYTTNTTCPMIFTHTELWEAWFVYWHTWTMLFSSQTISRFVETE